MKSRLRSPDSLNWIRVDRDVGRAQNMIPSPVPSLPLSYVEPDLGVASRAVIRFDLCYLCGHGMEAARTQCLETALSMLGDRVLPP